MRKVYVVNKGGHDYSAAERYGPLIFCTDGTMPRFNTSQMYREIQEAMQDSTPDDYILLTSLTILNTVACGLFAHKHGRLNLLLYQPKKGRDSEGEYLERAVVFNQPRARGTGEVHEKEDEK